MMIYLIAFAVAIAGAFGWLQAHDHRIRGEEADKWKPQLSACKLNQETEHKANLALQDDLKKLQDVASQQNTAVTHIATDSDRAIELSRKLVAVAEAKQKAAEAALNALKARQRTSTIPKDASCEVKLAAVHEAIEEAVTTRLKWALGIALPPAQ